MIVFNKLHDINKIEKIILELNNKNINYDSNTLVIFNLEKDGKILAFVAADIDSIYLRLLYLKLADNTIENIEMEFLLRSICVYAQNKNKFTIKYKENIIKSKISTLHSYTINGISYIDTLNLYCDNCNY